MQVKLLSQLCDGPVACGEDWMSVLLRVENGGPVASACGEDGRDSG